MLRNVKKNSSGGFSLIEMLLYISILVFMLAIVLGVVISIFRADKVIKSARRIENSTIVSVERISRELRQANSVNINSSILEVHPGVLVLDGIDSAGLPRSVEFFLSSDKIMMRENSVELGPLTLDTSKVTSLVFRRFAEAGSEGIRTEMTIESGTSTHYRVETFYSTTLIRR